MVLSDLYQQTFWLPLSLLAYSTIFCVLLQVLQNNAKYQVVPKKLTIGKRLAQCLHPALPSGVHRKALETYEIIFKIIGPKRLAKDLFLYRYCGTTYNYLDTKCSANISTASMSSSFLQLGALPFTLQCCYVRKACPSGAI